MQIAISEKNCVSNVVGPGGTKNFKLLPRTFEVALLVIGEGQVQENGILVLQREKRRLINNDCVVKLAHVHQRRAQIHFGLNVCGTLFEKSSVVTNRSGEIATLLLVDSALKELVRSGILSRGNQRKKREKKSQKPHKQQEKGSRTH